MPAKWFATGPITCGQCGAPWDPHALTCSRCGARAGRRVVKRRSSVPPLAMLLILVLLGSLAVIYTVGLWNAIADLLFPPRAVSGTVTALIPEDQDLFLLEIAHRPSGSIDLCAGKLLRVGDRVTAVYSAGNHTLYQLEVTRDGAGTAVPGQVIYNAAGSGLCPDYMPLRQVRIINITVGGMIALALDSFTLALAIRWGVPPLWRRTRTRGA